MTDSAPSLRHRLEYLLARGFAGLVRSVPLPFAYWCARRGGDLLHLVAGRHRRIAHANLRARLLDDAGNPPDDREVRRITREVFRHLVKNGVEMLVLPDLLEERGFDALVDESGAEHLRNAAESGRGAIFVTGHIGNWEVMGAACGEIGVESLSVYRPLDNPLLDRWVRDLRARSNQRVVPKHGAVRHLVRELRKGGVVAVLIDQDARSHGIFAPFMGVPSSTIPTPAELALRTGAAIIPGFAIRQGEQFRFRQWFDAPLDFEPTGDREADVLAIMTELNRRLEEVVRRHPEQWLWVHRRWKTAPPAADDEES